MFLTWLIIGGLLGAAAIITVAVVITATVILEIMRDSSNGLRDSLSATIQNKLNDGNHTVIKVNFKKRNGSTVTREIKSELGASVYIGQMIYNR